jgi:hypothetical protein
MRPSKTLPHCTIYQMPNLRDLPAGSIVFQKVKVLEGWTAIGVFDVGHVRGGSGMLTQRGCDKRCPCSTGKTTSGGAWPSGVVDRVVLRKYGGARWASRRR